MSGRGKGGKGLGKGTAKRHRRITNQNAVQGDLNDVHVGTRIELLWPPSGQWQLGNVTKVWGNGEYAIKFDDDRMYNFYKSIINKFPLSFISMDK